MIKEINQYKTQYKCFIWCSLFCHTFSRDRQRLRGDYTDELHICAIRKRSGTRFHALALQSCDTLLDDIQDRAQNAEREAESVGRIYVSTSGHKRKHELDPRRFLSAICETSSGVLYGTVSTGDAFCDDDDDHRVIYSYEFFAFAEGQW